MSSTVAKAVALLDYFTEEEPEIGLSDMARRSGIDKATVHRMLGVMSEAGLVEQRADTRLYRLGAGVLRLARVRETAFPIASVVEPLLEALSEETGETAHASLISGRVLANIGTCESKRGSRVSLVAGEVLPFHSTASGLATLAFGPEGLMDKVLAAPLDAKTALTITDPAGIRVKIDTVRRDGFSESDQAHEDDVFGIAAPLFDHSGVACGAVSVSTPSHRMTQVQRSLTIRAVLRTAAMITEGIGGKRPARYVSLIASTLEAEAR